MADWTMNWSQFKAMMDSDGNYSQTAGLVADVSTEKEIQIHHTAPHVGFKIAVTNSTVKITAWSETYENSQGSDGQSSYAAMHPKIHFYYANRDTSVANYSTKAISGLTEITAGGGFATGGDAIDYNSQSLEQNCSTSSGYADVYMYCEAGACQHHHGGTSATKIGSVQLHTHILNPAAPTITATSGTTITVSGGDDVRQGSGSYYSSPHTFTRLSKGTEYSFSDRKKCSCGKYFTSGTTKGKTWNITCQVAEQGYTTMTFSGKQTAGTKGSNTNNINYYIYKKDGTLVKKGTITSASGDIDSNGNYRIGVEGLSPNVEYYCKVESAGIKNASGVCDNTAISNSKSTFNPTPITPGSSDSGVSATTLKTYISFGGPDEATVSCTASCSGGSITKSSSDYFVFTGLTPGQTYTVSYTVTITVTSTITNLKGNKKTVTNTYTQSGTACTETTYKAEFGSISTTSKIVRFSSYCNKSDAAMEQKITDTDWKVISQNSAKAYNNLTHNTTYSIYARVYGCYAFDSSGSTTSWNDSEISSSASTLLFSLSGSISEEHQHRIVTLWQAYVGGSARDSDAIDGTLFEFTSKITKAKKVYPYQRSEVTEGFVDPNNGQTSGTYQTDKKVYSENLKWYYCEYEIIVRISDGYNVVEASVIAHTTFPHAWIYSGGRWHKAMGHVYTNGAFVPAPCFAYKGSSFGEPNGE